MCRGGPGRAFFSNEPHAWQHPRRCRSELTCWAAATPIPPARDHLNIVFIGHIDAGKSTLAGQILFLTVRGAWAHGT